MGLFSSKNRGSKDPDQPVANDIDRAGSDPSGTTAPQAPATNSSSSPPSGSVRAERAAEDAKDGGRPRGMNGTTPETSTVHQTSEGSKGEKRMATMGQSIVFKGEMSGDEDLEIEGQVDGLIELANHQLTIGANGRLKAEVHAKSIVVIGHVTGNLSATERIEIQATGVVTGDVQTPRLNVQEGAVINGKIDMSGSAARDSQTTQSTPTATEALKSA